MNDRNIRARRRERPFEASLHKQKEATLLPLQQPRFTTSRFVVFFLGAIFGFVISKLYSLRVLTNGMQQLAPSIHNEQNQPPLTHRTNSATASNLGHFDCYITIYSYDRPRALLNLLQDIIREADHENIRVAVNVIDDNSYGCIFPPIDENMFDVHGTGSHDLHLVKINFNETTTFCAARSRFRHVENTLRSRNWNLYVSKYRHGRRRHWHLIRMAHMLLHPTSADYYMFLPDDDRLATGFFTNVFHHWNVIKDERKLTLMLHVEETRENVAVWTKLKPEAIGNGIIRIGWVESGNFVCTEKFLRFMNWSFPRVPLKRWKDNPPISSGVGSKISELVHASNMRMYRTDKSFVAHVGVSSSKMNAEFRPKGKPFLLTKYFADGDEKYEAMLLEAATATVSIASHWTRETSLHSAINSLGPQVDHINVYLNDYDRIPPYLQAPYITVMSSKDKASRGDIGDIGKFFWSNEITTEFHLTADDDLIYPEDYVTSLIAFWRKYKAPLVVSAHGIRIKHEELSPPHGRRGKGYYGSREVWMAMEMVNKPAAVHILGTGTMLYRPHDIGRIEIDSMFPSPNMADIWFAILAQRLKLPMVVIPHHRLWIQEIPGTFENSIYKQSTRTRNSERNQTEAVKSVGTWEIHEPVLVSAE